MNTLPLTFPVREKMKFDSALMIDDFNILILYRRPAFDQKAVRVVIAPGNVPQVAFGDQTARHRACRPDDVLRSVAAKCIRVRAQINRHAVHLDLLADIPRDDIGVIAALRQVIVFFFGRAVGEVKRLSQVGLDDFIIRIQREE